MKIQLIAATLMFGSLYALGQYTNRSSVLDGSGTISSGGVYTNISASGQPGGISMSLAGSLPVGADSIVNQAGFLNTFFLSPGLDTNGNGVPDEADPDNDSDGLSDVAEIQGGSFIPATLTQVNVRDSDADGFADGQESVMGTDPLNAGSFLRIVSINNIASRNVSWAARSNKTYKVYVSDSSFKQPTNLLATVTATGFASAPWYELTNSVTDAAATNARFYAVEAQPGP